LCMAGETVAVLMSGSDARDGQQLSIAILSRPRLRFNHFV